MMMMGGYQPVLNATSSHMPYPQYPQYYQASSRRASESSISMKRAIPQPSIQQIQRASSGGAAPFQVRNQNQLRQIQATPASCSTDSKVDPNIVHPKRGKFPVAILPKEINLQKLRAPQQHRVLCYGDSLTAGLAGNYVTEYAPYATRLSELLNCKVDHVGLSGWTTEQMISIVNKNSAVDVKDRKWEDAGLAFALNKAIDEGRPYTCVIIMGGTNDLWDKTPSDIVTNLMLLHHHAKAAGAVSVAVGVPRHGALVCKKYENDMGKEAARDLHRKISAVNSTLKSAVDLANAKDENGGWISYVDAHAEVIRRVGNDPQKAMNLFAGFPTLKEYRDFMLLSARGQGSRAVQSVQRAFAHYSEKDLACPIQHTSVGHNIRMTQPQQWSMMEDPLHFSPEGYRAFAEAMHSMVAEHIISGRNYFARRRSSSAGRSSSSGSDNN